MDDLKTRLGYALSASDVRQSEEVLHDLAHRSDAERAALLPDLRAALTHADSLIRCRAIRALVALQSEAAECAPLLLQRLRDASWPVREAAAVNLSKPEWTWPGLREALVISVLHDPQKLVRHAAASALAHHPEDSQAAATDLCQSLQDPHVSIRCRALIALGRLPAQAVESLPHVRKALHESHWRVRMSAAEAMGELREAAIPTLPDLLRRRVDGHPRVSRAAEVALNRISPTLPTPLRVWLVTLAWGQGTMEERIRRALARPDLPESVQRECLTIAIRRASWRQSKGIHESQATQEQEQAWLLAKLFELLCRHAGI